MPFSNGEEVRINKAGLIGRVVRERLEGEDIYLVHVEDQYVRGSDLESLGQPPIDYEIEPSGDMVKLLSQRATQRGSGSAHPQIGARLAFKTKHDTAEFVRVGEQEGFTFTGKQFIVGY